MHNYLAHAEATRLAALKTQRLLGQCDNQCESEIVQLETLDRVRNQELARCEENQTPACQQATAAVRQAAAQYIRLGLNTPSITHTYTNERAETIALARQTMGDFTVWNVLQGAAGSTVEGLQLLATGARRGFDALLGNPTAQKEVRQTLGALWDAAQGPDFWLGLVGAMTPAQREQLALAYERGDGKLVAQMVGQVLSSIPMGGGAGTVRRLGELTDHATDAARVQQLAARADVKAVIEVPAGNKGNWDPRINTGTTRTLAPSTAYMLDNGHVYITDGKGRVKEVTGQLSPNTMARNHYQQGCAGASGCAGDDGGHLIASSLGGAGDRINIVPQAATLNRQDWKDMENFLRNELRAGKSVTVKIDVGYPPGGGGRPSEFVVSIAINGKPQAPRTFSQ
ncbi:MAG: ESAT-6 secretion machinery protein EssD [Dehalococcoidia bacterium]|nr:ESAT-6 secretion machinery protein EssD [Chloroflexota bacterium]